MDTSIGGSTRSLGPAQKRIIRSSSVKRKSKVTPVSERVHLERVLGFTCNCNAALASDPNTGLIAYPAGCVVVVLNPKKNKQSFLQSKKTITCLAFSGDGRHLVTGESGYQPMVRVWDVEEKTQIAEFSGHKFGINCVVFSPNMKYIVSIGSQHDMSVSVWNWRSNTKVASNKVASKVTDISFSEDGSYFVTVGNRHVKFWYLDTAKSKVKEVVPLNGRSGILGEQKNNHFCGVACGKGVNSSKTFAITHSGLLCEFNDKRLLDKWVELRVTSSQCIAVSEHNIYSGCADGVLRVFSAASLHYLASLPKPHYLGVDVNAGTDVSSMPSPAPDARFPDTVAVRYDEANKKVTTVYNDHSLYVWDVSNLKKVGKARSYMYHSACVWGVEVYPKLEENKAALPPGSFVTCSSDDTIRIWNVDPHVDAVKRNIYSQDLMKVIYTDDQLSNIKDVDFNPAGKNDKTDTQSSEKRGVRCVKVSPDGQHLASGDRMGSIRIHDLQFMDQLNLIEAHNSEVLCLEFTQPEAHGVRLLASASRDRLLHVFDADQDYEIVQTMDDHSSAITAVRFSQQDGGLHMLSCGADKSILFRTAQPEPEFGFVLNRHLVGRTTLYDMDIDPTNKFVATACQDRNVRIYNIKNGKQKKSYKGSQGEDGTLIKVHLDPSGGYMATSCSNKSLAIIDFFTGEVMATMFGHSELVTGVRFTNDLKHLISVAADGCVFVWRLPLDLTQHMISRMVDLGKMSKDQLIANHDARRGTFLVGPTVSKSMGHLNSKADQPDLSTRTIGLTPLDNDKENKKDKNANDPRSGYRCSVTQLPAWAKRTASETPGKAVDESNNQIGPRGRWAQRVDNQGIIMKSMLDENSAIQLSLSSALDRRRFTVEQESINEQLKSLNIRRDTIIKTDIKSVPIITDDDETNKDDEEDDEFCMEKEKRLNNGDSSLKMDSITTSRGDGSLESPHSLLKTNSIDLLLDETEEEEDYEEDEGDTDSDTKVIYMPNEDGSESSETIASSFRVIEGDTTSYKDAESEGTDALSISDEDSEPPSDPSTPMTPGDPHKIFMSEAERDFEDLGSSPALKESFTNTLEELEQMAGGGSNDPGHYFNHRLSISSRFISRAQTQHLRNLAMQAAQENANGNDKSPSHGVLRQRRLPSVPELGTVKSRAIARLNLGGWKSSGDEDSVPEKDSSSSYPVSQRSRPKLEPPPPPQPTRLVRDEGNRGRHSLGYDQDTHNRSESNEENKVARSEVKLDSPSRGRSLSTQDEDTIRESQPHPRSKSATPLDNPSSKRKSLPKQPSFAKPTESSSAKSGPQSNGSSPSKVRFANKKGGKLNNSMKNKFKSTPDLAAAMKSEVLKPISVSKTTEDIHDIDISSKKDAKNVRRSMPATREMKDPFGLNKPAVETHLPEKQSNKVNSNKYPNHPSVQRKVSIGESMVINEDKIGPVHVATSSGLSITKSETNQTVTAKSSTNISKEEEDRLKMPPPPFLPPASKLSKAGQEAFIKKSEPAHNSTHRKSNTELTLDQAKAILLGRSDSQESLTRKSPKNSPEKEEPKRSISVKIPEKRFSGGESSLDVPLEGSPDKDTVPPPGSSMFNKFGANAVMPMDLPVKDHSSHKHSRPYGAGSGRRFGRISPFDKPNLGEYDDGGDDIFQEADVGDEGEGEPDPPSTSSNSSLSTSSMHRRERSLSPPPASYGSTPSNSNPSSPTRHRPGIHQSPPHASGRSLPELPVYSKTSPLSSGNTSPLHGSPRLRPRHLRKSDEGPVPFTHGLRVFTGELNEPRDASREGSLSPTLPTPPSSMDPPLGVPKSKSMPEVGTENKALDELCLSVTATLDALVNKPLPGRSPKATSQPPPGTDWRKKSSGTDRVAPPLPAAPPPATPASPATAAPAQYDASEVDADADTEIQRPDKTRSSPPTSLTTALPSGQSSAKVVLASPTPPDRSRLSLPVSKVNVHPDPETDPDLEACNKMAADLKASMEAVIQAFNKIPKAKKEHSGILLDSLTGAQSALTEALGTNNTTSTSSNSNNTDPSSRIIAEAAERLSDQALQLLRAKLDQALH